MQTLSLFSPAKINLFLHITGKRTDGYHNLQSVFRAIDFGDTLDFVCQSSTNPTITLSGADHLTDDPLDNLIIKAANALMMAYPKHAKSTHISLKKQIPTGAGLGGGSSNCATTLIALNELWQLNLAPQTLINLAKTLGADVPFFIFAHYCHPDALAMGIGEHLTAIDLPAYQYLLLLPDEHLSTKLFFANPALKKDCPIIDNLHTKHFTEQLSAGFGNVFEPIACQYSPKVADALAFLRTLEKFSHTHARMSGTGSTVFLPIPAHIDQNTLQTWQSLSPCASIIAKSIIK